MDNETAYYRTEYFCKNRFVRYAILKASKTDIRKITDTGSEFELKVFRCNEKGNNYTGRLVFWSVPAEGNKRLVLVDKLSSTHTQRRQEFNQ